MTIFSIFFMQHMCRLIWSSRGVSIKKEFTDPKKEHIVADPKKEDILAKDIIAKELRAVEKPSSGPERTHSYGN